jgi:hypothetical protein
MYPRIAHRAGPADFGVLGEMFAYLLFESSRRPLRLTESDLHRLIASALADAFSFDHFKVAL